MTRREYDNTVRDLLGDRSRPAQGFVPEEEAMGFDNNANALGVTSLLAEQYLVAAEALSVRATENLQALLQCDPSGNAEDACIRGFVKRFGARAWRRPLTADDETLLLGVYDAARQTGDVRAGVEATLQVILQSPSFLYRVEVGELGPWQLASRLSYFLWGSMPDDELFAAAAEGRLGTPEEVEAQARRMIADPRAHETVLDFHRQWLRLDEIAEVEKDPATFPDWTPALAAQLARNAEAFVDRAAWSDDGDLASFFGGVLTQSGLLALLAKPNQTSPIHRGKFVREQLLCQVLPPPPEGIVITPPEPDPNASTRERFAEHSANPACAGCHSLMDPIGFGFEHYDGMGRFRSEENGRPIDATGELGDTDVDGPFDGVGELAARLAGSEQVHACMSLQWFRYAYGRGETEADACTLEHLEDAFIASGDRIEDLMIALTQTDAFLHRPTEGAP